MEQEHRVLEVTIRAFLREANFENVPVSPAGLLVIERLVHIMIDEGVPAGDIVDVVSRAILDAKRQPLLSKELLRANADMTANKAARSSGVLKAWPDT